MKRKYNRGVADSNRKRTKHGGAVDARQGGSERLYTLWSGIKDRCLNPNASHYNRYGGRGVTICQRWVDNYAAFREDVGDAPGKGMTIDRIDNNKGYSPKNVRWSTRKEQANNRVTNVVLTHKGKTMTLKQWSEELGWKYGLIASRWKKGLRGKELFAKPCWDRNKTAEYRGEIKTLRKWADDSGVSYTTLYWRQKHNKPLF